MNQYVFCGNNPVNFVDPFGLRWGNKPEAVGLQFTEGDVVRALRVAQSQGIAGPGGASWSVVWQTIKQSKHTVRWGKATGKTLADRLSYTRAANGPNATGGIGSSATVYFQDDACPKKKTPHVLTRDRKTKEITPSGFFESGIIHEISHAYEFVTGTADPIDIEEGPTRIGNALNSKIPALKASGEY